MIQVVAGLPGEGKSLYLSWLVAQWARVRPTYTNLELMPAHPAYNQVYKIGTDAFPVFLGDQDIKDRLKERLDVKWRAFWEYVPRGAAIVIDEADINFDCGDHTNMARQVRIYFKQHRHLANDVVLAVQQVENLYVRIRRLTGEWIWCHRDTPTTLAARAGWFSMFISPAWYRWRRTAFSGPAMSTKELVREDYFTEDEARSLFGWYRSDQIIGVRMFGQQGSVIA